MPYSFINRLTFVEIFLAKYQLDVILNQNNLYPATFDCSSDNKTFKEGLVNDIWPNPDIAAAILTISMM